MGPSQGNQYTTGWCRRVLELTYATWELEPFASDCAWDGPPFRWDEQRRFLLRCELDAAFFHLYLAADERGDWQPPSQIGGSRHDETPKQLAELTGHFPTPRDAVDYIMDTFPILRRKNENRYGEISHQTCYPRHVPTRCRSPPQPASPTAPCSIPPPADRTCCHPPRITVLDLASLADGEWA